MVMSRSLLASRRDNGIDIPRFTGHMHVRTRDHACVEKKPVSPLVLFVRSARLDRQSCDSRVLQGKEFGGCRTPVTIGVEPEAKLTEPHIAVVNPAIVI